jgi:sulfite exporter TauE/SafE
MGVGTSIFLIAVGAILDFAIDVQTSGFNLHTIGVILMVVGAIGLVFSLIFWNSWGGFHRTAVYEDGGRRGVVRDDML